MLVNLYKTIRTAPRELPDPAVAVPRQRPLATAPLAA